MDDRRFDELTRTLSGGADRRAALKRAAGGTLAGLLALRGGRAGATDICYPPCNEKNCETCKYGHCKSTCDPKQCEVCKDGSCRSKCRADQVCDYGTCTCPKGTKECRGTCIREDACCTDEDCKGTGQVCCPNDSPKAGRCIGHGKEEGNRACYHGDFPDA